MIRRVSVLAP